MAAEREDCSGVECLAGSCSRALDARPLPPYDALVRGFLADLSVELLSDKTAMAHRDVVSFAYWCRRAHVESLSREMGRGETRLGRGLVFHVTPSNVPIAFAFSYALSLLAGNASIVRVPTNRFPQVDVVCAAIERLCADQRYETIARMTAFVRYERDEEITRAFSACCDARVIWGGDRTIDSIRRMPIPPRSVEVTFADRYSLCVIDAGEVLRASSNTLDRLARSFYNDTYAVHQNACSSPHLVVWLGSAETRPPAKERFWDRVSALAVAAYDLEPLHAVEKYVALCESAIRLSNLAGTRRYGNYVYRLELATLPAKLDDHRGLHGYFYECDAENVDAIASAIDRRVQTLTYFGADRNELADFVVRNRLSGIDRIVPVGSALDIGVWWDGYDVVRTLSRVIEVK